MRKVLARGTQLKQVTWVRSGNGIRCCGVHGLEKETETENLKSMQVALAEDF